MPRFARTLISLAAGCSAALALAAPAQAGQRFASAASSDAVGSCAAMAPCELEHAVNDATAGDEVIVLPGTYSVHLALSAAVPIDLHGAWGQPRPRLMGTGNLGASVLTLAAGGSTSWLAIENHVASAAALDMDAAAGSKLVLTSPTGTGATLRGASLLRDSVVYVRGANPAMELKDGKAAGAAKLLNVSVVASSNGAAAIKAKQGTGTATIRNSIVRGGANDLLVYPKAGAAVDHSNLRPTASSAFTDAGANQSGDPLFANVVAGDLHLRRGSPAVDAGTPSDANLESTDADGAQRVYGTAPDMGAYELGAAGGGSGSRDGSTGPAVHLAPPRRPIAGSRVNVGTVRGHVRVHVPGHAGFVPLEAAASVPVNSVLDTRHGVVALTSARGGGSRRSQTGRFWGGRFKVVQHRRGSGYTQLVLAGGSFKRCASPARAKLVMAARKRTVRRLWGRDRHGRFRSRGRRGDATVRGTQWLTEDRCDGTLFKVRHGAIKVRAKHVRKTVLLRAGQRYLARAR